MIPSVKEVTPVDDVDLDDDVPMLTTRLGSLKHIPERTEEEVVTQADLLTN